MARVLIATQSWSPITRNALGVLQIQATTSVAIANTDGSAATTWSAQTGGTSSTAPQLTDSNGNIQRWIEEGEYDVTVGGELAKRVEATAGKVPALTRTGPLDSATVDTLIKEGQTLYELDGSGNVAAEWVKVP